MIDRQLPASAFSWANWLLAIRPATLSAAVAPVLVGTAAAAGERFRAELFVATLAASLFIQIGANLSNDLFDYERGADTPDRLGPLRVTQSGLIPLAQVRSAAYLAFGAAAAIGLYLVYEGGWPILATGLHRRPLALGLPRSGRRDGFSHLRPRRRNRHLLPAS